MIAIKNADGTLVPVIESTVGADRTVALSLVHNNQKRAEILLFEIPDTAQASHVRELPQTEAFGKLVLRRLPDNPFGEVEIQARLSIDPQFNIHVVAGAMGEKTVSGTFRIPSLGGSAGNEVPIYEEEPLAAPAAVSIAPPTHGSEFFIDDPDDNDWGFDELANPEDEEIVLHEDEKYESLDFEDEPVEDETVEQELAEQKLAGVAEDRIDSAGSIETTAEDDFVSDAFLTDAFDEVTPQPYEDAFVGDDDAFDETFDDENDFGADEEELLAPLEPAENSEIEEAATTTQAEAGSNPVWSSRDIGFLRASIVLFGISLVELGAFFLFRLFPA